ncbi:MAG: hypothetical protein N4A72_02245 [Bacteroidales bacterium]|jgi:hypothetical protein|nr:hypothetical protein [Bacteroidales bacterium]
MEHRDYIIREIEKIGSIISNARQKLFGGKDNLSVVINKQADDIKGELLNELNFDLDKFMNMNIEESNEYLNSFIGFNTENIELLAECLSLIGFNNESDNSERYLQKALALYEIINTKSKTFSFDREQKIIEIKKHL